MDKSSVYAIVVVLILIFLYFLIIYGYTPDQFIAYGLDQPIDIEYYDFTPKSFTKSVCFIAGVHGNEPAGSAELRELLESGYFRYWADDGNIKIRVIPAVNKWGLRNNTRYQPNVAYPDINRNFHEEGLEPVSKSIINLVADYDVVVDFHEGWGFHRINSASVGSSISPGNSDLSIKIAEQAVKEINKIIDDPYKKFIVLYNRSCEIPRTLSCHRKTKRMHYLLVETSGQNNIQRLEVRKEQVFSVVEETLKMLTGKNIWLMR